MYTHDGVSRGWPVGHGILRLVNRHLRLALILAALVAAAPMPSVRVVDAARADVGVAWFVGLRGDRTSRPHRQQAPVAAPAAAAARRAFSSPPGSLLPDAVLTHSLFQRPPPLQF